MGEVSEERREFLKRAKSAAIAVGAGAVVIAATTQSYARGETNGKGGVAVGRSRKSEILYRKTQQWEQFYKSAM
ncbi:MAG: twin-arginine translocation signal domain-containing protein [Helicobacteraceae bacterium]|jgi:hypothetical protein|nr:twin-arginine translocation signal domain-containing protein [Helicobacteraceae bacterium]